MENIVTKQNAGFPWREAGKKLLQILLVCYAAILVMTLLQVVLYAVPGEEDTACYGCRSDYARGFAGLLDIVTAMVSAIGTIILLWGFFEWGCPGRDRTAIRSLPHSRGFPEGSS